MSPALPPIYRDCRRLLVHTEEAVRRFARYHKYTVGADLRRQAMAVMRGVHHAVFDKPRQIEHIEALIWRVDDYKLTLQLAMEVGAFTYGAKGTPSFAAFETASGRRHRCRSGLARDIPGPCEPVECNTASDTAAQAPGFRCAASGLDTCRSGLTRDEARPIAGAKSGGISGYAIKPLTRPTWRAARCVLAPRWVLQGATFQQQSDVFVQAWPQAWRLLQRGNRWMAMPASGRPRELTEAQTIALQTDLRRRGVAYVRAAQTGWLKHGTRRREIVEWFFPAP